MMDAMNHSAVIMCIVVLGLAGSSVLAQTSQSIVRHPATALALGTTERYTFAWPQTPPKDLKAMIGLSDDQAAKIADIQTATAKTNADYQAANAEKLKTAHDAMDAATNRRDAAATARTTQKVRELEKPMTDAWEKARFEILAVLTPQQVQAWRKAMVVKSVKFTFDKVRLTTDQIDKVGALYDELAKQPGATFEGINAKTSQRVPDLLTPEQRKLMGVGR